MFVNTMAHIINGNSKKNSVFNIVLADTLCFISSL